MLIDKIMNKFGYSEMYEWSEHFKFNIIPFGRFVTFADNEPGKIKLANNNNDIIIGVTTINSLIESDNPEEWQGKYLCNEYGDILLKNYKNIIYPVINDNYNKDLKYIKRTERKEWIRVNLLGKCIVVDNGECKPGKYCMIGKDGIAVPYDVTTHQKYYIIDRLSENTIMIFFK